MPELLTRSLVLLSIAAAGYLIARLAVLPLVYRAVRRTATRWDDILADQKVLNRLSWLIPVLVARLGAGPILRSDPGRADWAAVVERVLGAGLVLAVLFVFSAVAAAIDRIYAELDTARERPIKGYLQVGVIVAWVIGAIVVLAVLADQDIGVLIGGLGAFSAVVILVFRDTILSLVASVQLTGNDMLRVGDWIEMPSQNADGDVIEIALHTVKVQNWDKTITTVPTYKLITEAYKNWRGMSESGGRRIKRHLLIDQSTVRFLTDAEIARWRRFDPLAEHLDHKTAELEEWNRSQAPAPDRVGDLRRLTNLGTFRAYVDAYLERHPMLATEQMTKLVRQLQPTEHGLPLEIYVFTSTTDWDVYEAIQADIFDHLIAMVGEFGLRLHQAPTGGDITALAERRTTT
jgi:miniconductance mechanosensitive channel